jgi:hypothetical protein
MRDLVAHALIDDTIIDETMMNIHLCLLIYLLRNDDIDSSFIRSPFISQFNLKSKIVQQMILLNNDLKSNVIPTINCDDDNDNNDDDEKPFWIKIYLKLNLKTNELISNEKNNDYALLLRCCRLLKKYYSMIILQ